MFSFMIGDKQHSQKEVLMPLSILGPLNKVINETTNEVLTNDIPKKVAGVLSTFVDSMFDVVEDGLKKIADATKEDA